MAGVVSHGMCWTCHQRLCNEIKIHTTSLMNSSGMVIDRMSGALSSGVGMTR